MFYFYFNALDKFGGLMVVGTASNNYKELTTSYVIDIPSESLI